MEESFGHEKRHCTLSGDIVTLLQSIMYAKIIEKTEMHVLFLNLQNLAPER